MPRRLLSLISVLVSIAAASHQESVNVTSDWAAVCRWVSLDENIREGVNVAISPNVVFKKILNVGGTSSNI